MAVTPQACDPHDGLCRVTHRVHSHDGLCRVTYRVHSHDAKGRGGGLNHARGVHSHNAIEGQ